SHIRHLPDWPLCPCPRLLAPRHATARPHHRSMHDDRHNPRHHRIRHTQRPTGHDHHTPDRNATHQTHKTPNRHPSTSPRQFYHVLQHHLSSLYSCPNLHIQPHFPMEHGPKTDLLQPHHR